MSECWSQSGNAWSCSCSNDWLPEKRVLLWVMTHVTCLYLYFWGYRDSDSLMQQNIFNHRKHWGLDLNINDFGVFEATVLLGFTGKYKYVVEHVCCSDCQLRCLLLVIPCQLCHIFFASARLYVSLPLWQRAMNPNLGVEIRGSPWHHPLRLQQSPQGTHTWPLPSMRTCFSQHHI